LRFFTRFFSSFLHAYILPVARDLNSKDQVSEIVLKTKEMVN